jgi:hypothetical protein
MRYFRLSVTFAAVILRAIILPSTFSEKHLDIYPGKAKLISENIL